MTDEAPFDARDPAFKRERAARRASRLAVYQQPVAADVKCRLAIEDAIDAIRRACFAMIDARFGQGDQLRIDTLREAYTAARIALDLTEQAEGALE